MGYTVQVSNLKRGEGAYRVCLVSGLLTGVAAATATAGHLWAMRWAPTVPTGYTSSPNTPRFCVPTRIKAKLVTISGFTAQQEVGIDLSVLRGYTASHTTGTAAVLTTTNGKKLASASATSGMQSSFLTDMRIGTTGALTAGTHTFDAQPIASDTHFELAAGATIAESRSEILWTTDDVLEYPQVLASGEGLCIRNTVLMGAGGTCRLIVEVDWLELLRVA